MKNRLNQAYHYLKGLMLISNQQDLADKMGYSRSSISKALNGYEDYLTESFMMKLYQTFQNVFNENWLLTGEGSMLKNSPESMVHEPQEAYGEDMASLIKENEDLKELVKDLKIELKSAKIRIEIQDKYIAHTDKMMDNLQKTIEILSSVKK